MNELGRPAVILGHSISGGAATIAAATAPEAIMGVIELVPFSRKQSFDLLGLPRLKRFRNGYTQMALVIVRARLANWVTYLDVATPVNLADWDTELNRIETRLNEPGRMKVLQSMAKSDPGDAGALLPKVDCPVLVIEGSEDPDWGNPC